MEAMGTAGSRSRSEGTGPSDHELVRLVRLAATIARSSCSTTRYQRRITAYVLGMVKDHGRAEDITQEVFVAALRRMRATERPIAFKPWVYEIARNACIDAYRRGRRGEEISYDADDKLTPADHGRLVAADPSRPPRSPPSSSSTRCSAPSTGSRTRTTRSSSCASSRA